MAAPANRLSIYLPWATLLKIIAAIAIVWVWRELVWVVMLGLVAVIIAVALHPAVCAMERRGIPRWLASWSLVAVIVGSLLGFLAITWSSLASQASDLSNQLTTFERTIQQHAPRAVVDIIRRSPGADASMLGSYVMIIGRSHAGGDRRLRPRVDPGGVSTDRSGTDLSLGARLRRRTAAAAIRSDGGGGSGSRTRLRHRQRDNVGLCGGVLLHWLEVLHVPAALLLALLAFVADFIPVVGFFLSCLPAMAMAATQSSATALAMVPIYLTYHVIENYILTPRVYAGRLRLSNLAVLLALAVGAELAGVMGALVALPVAAVYPTIERLWLREAFGDEVIEEHRAITAGHRPRHAS